VLLGSRAYAEDRERLTLQLHAPDTCPTAADLRGSIDRLLGRPAEQILTDPLQIAVEVQELPSGGYGLTLRIEPDSRGGQRELSGKDCEELVRAAAIIVALGIDPQLQLKEDQARAPAIDENPSPGGAEAPPSARPRTERARTPQMPRRTRLPDRATRPNGAEPSRWRLRAESTLTLGELPEPALGGQVGGGVVLDPMVFSLRGGLLGWQSKELDSYGGRFRLAAGALLACGQVVRGRFWAAPCGAVELHWLWARGLRIAEPRTESRFILELGAGLEAGSELWRNVGVVISALLLVPQERPSFVVDDRSVHAIPTYGGRVGAGLELGL
jgi:hypothetical protein